MTAAITGAVAALAASPDELAARFYRLLFADAPHLRSLFDADLSGQQQRFLGELGYLIGLAEQPDQMEARAEELGRRHAGYGVSMDDIGPFRTALVKALHEVVDDAAASAAWAQLIDAVLRAFAVGLVQSS